MTMNEPMVCGNCGQIGTPMKKSRGSKAMERFLWIVLFFPGIFYTIWRRAGRQEVCRKCGSTDLVSVDSRLGQAILQKSYQTKKTNQKTDKR